MSVSAWTMKICTFHEMEVFKKKYRRIFKYIYVEFLSSVSWGYSNSNSRYPKFQFYSWLYYFLNNTFPILFQCDMYCLTQSLFACLWYDVRHVMQQLFLETFYLFLYFLIRLYIMLFHTFTLKLFLK